MADGDALQLEDGRFLKVNAAAELVVEVVHKNINELMRLAWHLGNRHLPVEIRDEVLRIRPDGVIEAMLKHSGAALSKLRAPFQPEGGAYSSSDHHSNAHSGHHDE
jgi:urease accessory protein